MGGLVGLLVLILIVVLVAGVATLFIRQAPIGEPFKQLALALVLLIAVVVILVRALPLLGAI